jgi:kinetochore protein Mis12/MTW1
VDTREGVGGEGGRVRGEEVRALEGLVGGLGRGKKQTEGKENRDIHEEEEGEEDEGEAMDTS